MGALGRLANSQKQLAVSVDARRRPFSNALVFDLTGAVNSHLVDDPALRAKQAADFFRPFIKGQKSLLLAPVACSSSLTDGEAEERAQPLETDSDMTDDAVYQVALQPNPFESDGFRLHISAGADAEAHYLLADVSGRALAQGSQRLEAGENELAFGDFPEGMSFLSLRIGSLAWQMRAVRAGR
jgi:hypothetical protein